MDGKKKTTNLHCSFSCRDFRKRRFYWHTRASVSCMVTSAFHLSMCTRTPFLASCVCMRRTRRSLGCCLSSSGASLSYLSSNTSSLFLEQMTMEKVLLFSAHFFFCQIIVSIKHCQLSEFVGNVLYLQVGHLHCTR